MVIPINETTAFFYRQLDADALISKLVQDEIDEGEQPRRWLIGRRHIGGVKFYAVYEA